MYFAGCAWRSPNFSLWCRSIPSTCAGSRVYPPAFWVSCQRAGDFVATVLPLQGWRLRRPPPRSAYAYTPSGARPAESAHALKQSVPLAAAKSPAHVTFWPWGGESRPHPSLRAGPCALPRHPRPIRVAWLRRGIPRHRHARASARLPRTGRPPPPCARSSASPPHPDPRSGGASLSAALARSRLAAEALGSPASRDATQPILMPQKMGPPSRRRAEAAGAREIWYNLGTTSREETTWTSSGRQRTKAGYRTTR